MPFRQDLRYNTTRDWEVTVKERFIGRLKAKGFEVKDLGERLYLDSFPELKPVKNKAKVDFGKLCREEGIDLLILFSSDTAGTYREHYGCIPIGKLKAYFDATGEMIDLANNDLLWRYELDPLRHTFSNKHFIYVENDWNHPPDFPKVVEAIRVKAVDYAIDALEEDFFKN